MRTVKLTPETRKEILTSLLKRSTFQYGSYMDTVNRILELSVSHGFEGNLWQDYLTYLLASHENGYSTSCEIVGNVDGSINQAALHDFQIFQELIQ